MLVATVIHEERWTKSRCVGGDSSQGAEEAHDIRGSCPRCCGRRERGGQGPRRGRRRGTRSSGARENTLSRPATQ